MAVDYVALVNWEYMVVMSVMAISDVMKYGGVTMV